MHALRLDLEGEQALVKQLQVKLDELAASEQAVIEDAAAVRCALQAACTAAAQEASASGSSLSEMPPTQQQQQQQRPEQGTAAWQQQAGIAPAAAGGRGSQQGCTLGQEVGTAVGALVQRIHTLEQQLASQQQAMQEAERLRAVAPAVQAAGVQCSPPAQSDAAVQAAPADLGCTAAAAAQTDTDAAVQGSGAAPPAPSPTPDAGSYGRADPQQERVTELTAQLAVARLAEVSAKADHAAIEARLLEAERKVRWLVCVHACQAAER